MQIPITKPFLGSEELEAVQNPLKTGWLVQGPFVKEFEERFSAFTGARFSVATTSCTTALHIAVAALGLKPGDEVIVPAFTWVSTPNVIEYMGGTPIFCDVDTRTFNIDVSQISSLITPRTVGIIPVHLFGLCADMDPILAIARRRGLWVVEDAACAFGGWYGRRHAGTFGEMACFSFHPRKSITTGEGGMITTERDDLARLARTLRDNGASRPDPAGQKQSDALADYRYLGYNYRMTDIQGALGCAQIQKAGWILEQRRQLASRYDRLLSDLDWLDPPAVPESCIHGYQAYVCLFRPEQPCLNNVDRLHRQRNQVMVHLERMGIATRQGTHAPVLLDYYANKYGLRRAAFPNSCFADRLSLTLPLYPQMTEAEQIAVCRALRGAADAQQSEAIQ